MPVSIVPRCAKVGFSRAGRGVRETVRSPGLTEYRAEGAGRYPRRSVSVSESLGAESRDVLRQRDTYFNARAGQLKLREE